MTWQLGSQEVTADRHSVLEFLAATMSFNTISEAKALFQNSIIWGCCRNSCGSKRCHTAEVLTNPLDLFVFEADWSAESVDWMVWVIDESADWQGPYHGGLFCL